MATVPKASHGALEAPPATGEYVNEDICAACKRGGDLICCDNCPKSFHFECTDPPLAHVPEGDWFCIECATQKEVPKPTTHPAGSGGSVFSRLVNKLRGTNPSEFRHPSLPSEPVDPLVIPAGARSVDPAAAPSAVSHIAVPSSATPVGSDIRSTSFNAATPVSSTSAAAAAAVAPPASGAAALTSSRPGSEPFLYVCNHDNQGGGGDADGSGKGSDSNADRAIGNGNDGSKAGGDSGRKRRLKLPPHDSACFVCGGTQRSDRMAKCSMCPHVFHIDSCLKPALSYVPGPTWTCPAHSNADVATSRRKRAPTPSARGPTPGAGLVDSDAEDDSKWATLKLDFLGKLSSAALAQQARAIATDTLRVNHAFARTAASLHAPSPAPSIDEQRAFLVNLVGTGHADGAASEAQAARDKLRARRKALFAAALPSPLSAPVDRQDEVAAYLTPLFMQFLAWQRLMQLSYALGDDGSADAAGTRLAAPSSTAVELAASLNRLRGAANARFLSPSDISMLYTHSGIDLSRHTAASAKPAAAQPEASASAGVAGVHDVGGGISSGSGSSRRSRKRNADSDTPSAAGDRLQSSSKRPRHASPVVAHARPVPGALSMPSVQRVPAGSGGGGGVGSSSSTGAGPADIVPCDIESDKLVKEALANAGSPHPALHSPAAVLYPQGLDANSGLTFPMLKPYLVLGRLHSSKPRSVDVDLCQLQNPRCVSHVHAVLFLDMPGSLVLRTLGKNGSRVDGLLVRAGEQTRVRDGSTIEMGGVQLRVVLAAQSGVSPSPAPAAATSVPAGGAVSSTGAAGAALTLGPTSAPGVAAFSSTSNVDADTPLVAPPGALAQHQHRPD